MVSTRGAATHVSYAEEEVPPPETNGNRRRSARGSNAHYVEQDSDVSSDRGVGPSSRAGGSAGQQQQQNRVRIRRPSSKALSNTTPKKEQSTTRMDATGGQGRRLRSVAPATPGSGPVTPAGSPARSRRGQSTHDDVSTPPLRRNGEIAGYSTRSRGAPFGSEAASGEPSNQRSEGLANRLTASGDTANKNSELNQSSELSDGSMVRRLSIHFQIFPSFICSLLASFRCPHSLLGTSLGPHLAPPCLALPGTLLSQCYASLLLTPDTLLGPSSSRPYRIRSVERFLPTTLVRLRRMMHQAKKTKTRKRFPCELPRAAELPSRAT